MKNRLLFIFATLLIGQAQLLPAQPGKAKPNIILIYLDDMGYGDLGITGATGYSTPHINKLAQQGALLTHYYAPQAVCSASRLGLLTGCYPNRLGFHGALDHKSAIGIAATETTLPEMLQHQGYATAAFGKWHLGHTPGYLPLSHGFNTFFGIPYSNDMWPQHPITKNYYPDLPLIEGNQTITTNPNQALFTTRFTERTLDFMQAHQKQPFFIYLAHPMPHVPLFVSDRFKGKSQQGLYGDVMMEIDWSVGEIVKQVHKLGMEKNTLIIFTSDNGPWLNYGNHAGSTGGLREGKGTTFEGGQRVPCIFWWPGKIAPGKVRDALACGMDILPTLAEVSGSRLPALPIDGVSLWPVLSGKAVQGPRSTFLYYYRKNNLEAIRHGHWKLVFEHTGRSYAGQVPGKDGMPGPAPENVQVSPALYDLRRDPGEQYNLINQHPDVVATLNALAQQARADLGDDLTQTPGANRRVPATITTQTP